MPLQKITLTYHNTMKGVSHFPPEDFAFSRGNAFAVCDGVTLLHYHPYPNPSPAARAAHIAARTLVREIQSGSPKTALLRAAFRKANDAVRKYNQTLGTTPKTVNYLSRQYAATVAAYGTITGNLLHWGQINDCGVMVINRRGQVVVQQQLDRAPFDHHLAAVRKRGQFKAGSPEEHRYVRREVVNNLQLKHRGKQIFWGVMTGEPQVTAFLRVGKIPLKLGWSVVFYSDGAEPLLKRQPFRSLIAAGSNRRQIDRWVKSTARHGEKYQHERTMTIVSLKGRSA